MLEARNLHLRHGARSLIRDLDFRAAPGRITAIVGPNGAGKTTLLRALTGETDMGEVRLNGLALRGMAPARLARLRAVLPQSLALAFPFRVADLLRMGQEAGDCAAQPGLIEAALAEVGLAGFGPRIVTSLSGGEQARVHLARARAQVWQPVGPQGPRWLLLDEPVASLDIGHQVLVMRRARAFADAGGGVVAVMHDLNLTAGFADEVVLLGHGTRLGAGPPAAVLTEAALSQAYGCAMRLNTTPAQGLFVLPQMVG